MNIETDLLDILSLAFITIPKIEIQMCHTSGNLANLQHVSVDRAKFPVFTENVPVILSYLSHFHLQNIQLFIQ